MGCFNISLPHLQAFILELRNSLWQNLIHIKIELIFNSLASFIEKNQRNFTRSTMLNPKQQVEFINGVREGIMKDHIALGFSIQQEKYGWVYRNLCETNTWYCSGHRTKSKRPKRGVTQDSPASSPCSHMPQEHLSTVHPESTAPLAILTQPGSLSESTPSIA